MEILGNEEDIEETKVIVVTISMTKMIITLINSIYSRLKAEVFFGNS